LGRRKENRAVSTMKSQQVMWQGRAQELPISSKQQPGSLPLTRPVGIEAGVAAVLLAALFFSLVLGYAATRATITRNGYVEMRLRQDIEELRAQTALIRYQIHMAESSDRIHEAAARLGMAPSDAVDGVDYVVLPYSAPGEDTRLAAADPADGQTGLASALAHFAAGAVTAGGRAEASTTSGHRP